MELDGLLHALGLNTTSIQSFDFDRATAAPFGTPIILVVSAGNAYKINAAHGVKQTAAIGCAKLCTQDIRGLPPGADGAAWVRKASAYACKIVGRQRGEGAEQLTAGCDSEAVHELDIVEVSGWLRSGCLEPGSDEAGQEEGRLKLVICDTYEGGVTMLQDELVDMIEDMPRMTRVLCIVDLYNIAKPAHAPRETTLRGVCEALGIPAENTRNVKDRVEQTLSASVVLALKAAMTATPALEPSRRRFRAAVSHGFRTIAGRLRTITPWSTRPAERERECAVPNPMSDGHAVGPFPTLTAVPGTEATNPASGDAGTRSAVAAAHIEPDTAQFAVQEPGNNAGERLAAHDEINIGAAVNDAFRLHAATAAGVGAVRPPQEHIDLPTPPQTPNDQVHTDPGNNIPGSAVVSVVPVTTDLSDALGVLPTPSHDISLLSFNETAAISTPSTVPVPGPSAPLRPLASVFPALPASVLYPTPLPVGFTHRTCTPAEMRTMNRSRFNITNLPDRIKFYVRRYSAMTRILELWLIQNAQLHGCPTYSAMVYREQQDDGSTIRKISAPVENYENLAQYLAEKVRVPPSIIVSIYCLIEVRNFVSVWYTNVQDAEPPLPIDCEVRRKTDTHVHFTDMLRRLHTVLRDAQA
ncbi:hypothetical protein LTS10_003156 [Elasticomyces elasticus]|nr:hypothetical protein LTS10_003156 [Elasticomyces elasticus]